MVDADDPAIVEVAMTTYETRYDEVDWDNLLAEVTKSFSYLRLAWRATERDMPPELHRKMVEDLYVPAIKLLAEFCACIEESREEEGV
jgi:hypothetical protein